MPGGLGQPEDGDKCEEEHLGRDDGRFSRGAQFEFSMSQP